MDVGEHLWWLARQKTKGTGYCTAGAAQRSSSPLRQKTKRLPGRHWTQALRGTTRGLPSPAPLRRPLARRRRTCPHQSDGPWDSTRSITSHSVPEPRVLDALRVLLDKLLDVGIKALCDGGRHLENLLRGIARQALPVESSNTPLGAGGGAEVDERVASVALGREVNGQVEEVKTTLETSRKHLGYEFLHRVAAGDVAEHHRGGALGPVDRRGAAVRAVAAPAAGPRRRRRRSRGRR
mmetsp:Transcript_31270/g.84855  ORF Transcript_31270/g.84855 Transcript_31270/m.84855 type:complete len:237 (-) Transcript_31270:61-771(-)